MSRLFKEKQAVAVGPAMASETEQARQLSPTEREWKQRIYERLLKVLDLSLLGSLEEVAARTQIREITNRLLLEESAPLSLAQRQFVTRRIEDEVMGLGPLEPLLDDPTISDILVNGHDQVYIERRGKLELTEVRFNDDAHLMHIIDRIVVGGRAARRRVVARWWTRACRTARASTRSSRRWRSTARCSRSAASRSSCSRLDDLIRLGTLDETMAARCCNGVVQGAAQHRHLRRHRLRQDDAAERAVGLHSGHGAHRHDRGRGGTAAAAAARGPAGDPAAQHRGQGRGHGSATWCATPCACGRTGSSSASAAAPRRSTCCRP